MIEITRTKSWMERVGSWHSDVWNYLANIQELIQNLHISGATRLVIYTVKMVKADKEYSQRLPEHTKGFTIQTTDGTAFRLQTEPGRVAQARRPYWTNATNTGYDETDLDLTNATLYFASSTANKTVEIFVKV